MRLDCGSLEGARWYCVRTGYRAEFTALRGLSEAGFAGHLPMFVSRKRGHRERVLALFPRYLFVRFAIDADPWRRIFAVRGVEHLFCMSPERPVPMPPGEVEDLMKRGRPADGAIDDLGGKRLRVKGGVLAGHEGLCSWSDDERVALLVDLLGRQMTVEMDRDRVERVA